jgi:hypothetical protein
MLSSEKVGKLLVYFGRLFQVVRTQRAKFLQGSLFAIGGLLKIEAKSYLRTLQELRRGDVALTCPLFKEGSEMEQLEQQRVRSLSAEDLLFYENELVQVLAEFIQSLVTYSAGTINNGLWNFYLDFT